MKFKWSNLVTLLTLVALIASSLFVALILNPATPVGPVSPAGQTSVSVTEVMSAGQVEATSAGSVDGLLIVRLTTNQNPRDPLADPGNQVFPMANKSIVIKTVGNLSVVPGHLNLVIFTSNQGIATDSLPQGTYSVTMKTQSLRVSIPLQVSSNNITRLSVVVLATVYHTSFNEVSDASLIGFANGENIFTLIRSPVPIVKVGDTLQLRVRRSGGTGFITNATIVGVQPEGDNLWLMVQTPDTAMLLTASSLVFAMYDYSYSISMGSA